MGKSGTMAINNNATHTVLSQQQAEFNYEVNSLRIEKFNMTHVVQLK